MGSRKRDRRVIVLAHGLLILGLALLLGACSENGANGGGSIAVAGTWVLESDYDGDGTADLTERWTIDADSITYESDFASGFSTFYSADIVDFTNNGLNGGDTKLIASATDDASNPGFAVFQYTAVDGPGTGKVGKFNVFRWAENGADPAKKNFAQGYKNVGDDFPDNVNGIFDSASAAERGATNGNGYFGFASSGAVRD